MMEELKSIRLFSDKIKVNYVKASLYKLDNINFKVVIDLNGKLYNYSYNDSLYPSEKKELFNKLVKLDIEDINLISGFNLNNLTQYDYFLNDSIISLSKLLNLKFKIDQDPWLGNIPGRRNYGYEPYYLNNSTIVYIHWFVGNNRVGSYDWSDNDGNEIEFINFSTDKENIIKKVYIISPDSDKYTIEQNNMISTNLINSKIYPYNVKDQYILDEVIRIWKLKVNNYNLEKCNNLPCDSLEYKSPIMPNNNININTTSSELIKKKMNIELKSANIKVRDNFSIRIVLN